MVSQAQETPEQIVKRLADLGPGVQEIKAENGHLKSLKVVSQETISTVMGAAKGLQIAQKRASLKANAVFLEWMKNNVVTISESNDENIVTIEGNGQNVTEQGKASETTREAVIQHSAGLVRGLTLVAKDQKEDTLTLVYSWSPEKAALAKVAQKENESEGSAPETPAPSAPTTPTDKTIQPKTVVSPDFDK